MRRIPMATYPTNRYHALAERVFVERYRDGDLVVEFARGEIESAASELGIALPKNLGDIIYSLRYRTDLPKAISDTAPKGMEWTIKGMGRSRYAFCLVPKIELGPNPSLAATKIPDATPELVAALALSDEQALLAKIRYNRILDLFLGLVTYSLQSHLRTTVKAIGQIEVDELYVGVDRRGRQFVIPVQAKGGKDRLRAIQTEQDIALCRHRFPGLICRPISAQFMTDGRMALFELVEQEGQIRILEERHYVLVPAADISAADLATYCRSSAAKDAC